MSNFILGLCDASQITYNLTPHAYKTKTEPGNFPILLIFLELSFIIVKSLHCEKFAVGSTEYITFVDLKKSISIGKKLPYIFNNDIIALCLIRNLTCCDNFLFLPFCRYVAFVFYQSSTEYNGKDIS